MQLKLEKKYKNKIPALIYLKYLRKIIKIITYHPHAISSNYMYDPGLIKSKNVITYHCQL